ncbi:hypothetical protein EI42_06125 [Thermosporothrix hazakensis]|uniref:Uncharacterized protein n=1 Tax=Thermosporothrix hazakensis TaxID=644383 RepID=A0A326TSB4_THEHA|nr:hypothetical protein EI42_06125 [Thermosporothrix hazakensis]GCE48249.1 hypothetical protein KTH_31180 [Thermosporothrix hazakensis]
MVAVVVVKNISSLGRGCGLRDGVAVSARLLRLYARLPPLTVPRPRRAPSLQSASTAYNPPALPLTL